MGKKIGKSKRRGIVRAKASKTAIPARPSAIEKPDTALDDRERVRFVNDLMIRGEAAKLTKRGKLPLHATHVIKRQKKDGTVEVERMRFKTY